MVKQSGSKKSKQSHKTDHKSEHTEKSKQAAGKRQPSGYLMFCAEQRELRKNDFEKMKPKEIMQHLGAEWRKLSAQQQDAYKAKAPVKTHHEVCNKEESKSQKPQQTHTKSAAHHHSGTKTKGNTIHNTGTKGASKKKTTTKKIKHAHEKSASRKLAHNHHENNHENDVSPS